jgi:hypothetical protein
MPTPWKMSEFHKALVKDDTVIAMDFTKKWYKATVLNLSRKTGKVKVHYIGWDT